MTKYTAKQALYAACLSSLLLGGCATTNGGAGSDTANQDTAMRCAAFGAGGALLGAVIGGSRGAVKGAVAGLAACAVIEIVSRQTKTAAQVDQQYKANNRSQLPANATIDAYSTSVSPNGVVKGGEAIKIASTIRAVSGRNEAVQEVKEVLIAYSPSGEEFKRSEKKVNDSAGSGEYDNSFTLRLPQGAPQGIYKLKTQVFLNGKPTLIKESSMQLVQIDGVPGAVLALR